MNNLTSAQCDAFQKDHKEVAVSCWGTGKSQWEVYDQVGYDSPLVGADDVKTTTSELSREAAITAYWQKYHPDWTPPVEDTVTVRINKGWENAGRIGKKLGESILIEQWWTPVLWEGDEDPDWHKAAALTIVDPDKPEPSEILTKEGEETAMGLLREARNHFLCDVSIKSKIDTFLKEATDAS